MEGSDKNKDTYLISEFQIETIVLWFGLLYSPIPSPSVVTFLDRLVQESEPDGVTMVNYLPVV